MEYTLCSKAIVNWFYTPYGQEDTRYEVGKNDCVEIRYCSKDKNPFVEIVFVDRRKIREFNINTVVLFTEKEEKDYMDGVDSIIKLGKKMMKDAQMNN